MPFDRLTRARRRVYGVAMQSSSKRDNGYWLRRLKKNGRGDLIERIEAGAITVYQATQIAGYRQKGVRSPAAKLSYHWQRASAEERLRFIAAHPLEINSFLKQFVEQRKALKAKNSTDEEQK